MNQPQPDPAILKALAQVFAEDNASANRRNGRFSDPSSERSKAKRKKKRQMQQASRRRNRG